MVWIHMISIFVILDVNGISGCAWCSRSMLPYVLCFSIMHNLGCNPRYLCSFWFFRCTDSSICFLLLLWNHAASLNPAGATPPLLPSLSDIFCCTNVLGAGKKHKCSERSRCATLQQCSERLSQGCYVISLVLPSDGLVWFIFDNFVNFRARFMDLCEDFLVTTLKLNACWSISFAPSLQSLLSRLPFNKSYAENA